MGRCHSCWHGQGLGSSWSCSPLGHHGVPASPKLGVLVFVGLYFFVCFGVVFFIGVWWFRDVSCRWLRVVCVGRDCGNSSWPRTMGPSTCAVLTALAVIFVRWISCRLTRGWCSWTWPRLLLAAMHRSVSTRNPAPWGYPVRWRTAAGLTSPAGSVGPVRLFAGPIWKWTCARLADTLKTLHYFFQIKPFVCLINHTYVLNKRLSICINLTASRAVCWLQFFTHLCKIKKSMYYYQKSR